jgi:hypothetical protein
MPFGGARSATLERMNALSLAQVVRGTVSSSDHSELSAVADTYKLAV